MLNSLVDTKLKTAIWCALFSSVCLLIAYGLVESRLRSGLLALGEISLLAVAQIAFQLIAFYGLAKEPKPRWNLLLFCFMVTIAFIVVALSLWIMYNLDYRMMEIMPEGMGM
jgi:cytochrome o ubiquinol oxidase operon protein cyoD